MTPGELEAWKLFAAAALTGLHAHGNRGGGLLEAASAVALAAENADQLLAELRKREAKP